MATDQRKPDKSSPCASETPVHMLAEKKVKPSMIKNIAAKPLRADAGTASSE